MELHRTRLRIHTFDDNNASRDQCPSSKHLGRLSLFSNRGSGSSWFDVKPLGVGGSRDGCRWSVGHFSKIISQPRKNTPQLPQSPLIPPQSVNVICADVSIRNAPENENKRLPPPNNGRPKAQERTKKAYQFVSPNLFQPM